MIRPLRRRHFRMIAVLSVVLPILVAAALLSRPAPAKTDLAKTDLADALTPPAADLAIVLERTALPTDPPIVVEVRGDQDLPTRVGLYVAPEAALLIPDLLIYWQQDKGPRYLLGALRGATPQTFAMPDAARQGGGRIVLHSLARQEDIASANLTAR